MNVSNPSTPIAEAGEFLDNLVFREISRIAKATQSNPVLENPINKK